MSIGRICQYTVLVQRTAFLKPYHDGTIDFGGTAHPKEHYIAHLLEISLVFQNGLPITL